MWRAIPFLFGLFQVAISLPVDQYNQNQRIPGDGHVHGAGRSLLLTDERLAGLHPGYHISAPSGWINDPNGMFEHEGNHHVFFQYNPYAPKWASPQWGHVVSKDLVRWKWLPVALVPDQWYDHDGCFSGSAATLEDGSPALFYTGVSNFSQLGYYHQLQALAFPANLSDPDLREWRKFSGNPVGVGVPPGGDHSQFRDPITPWRGPSVNNSHLEVWYTAIGVQARCIGGAAMYSAETISSNWTFAGHLFTQTGMDPEGVAVCRVEHPVKQSPVVHSPSGQRNDTCDQFGTCRTWECPDYFTLGPMHIFKYSDQTTLREPWAADWYLISDQPLDMKEMQNRNDESGVFSGMYKNKPFEPQMIDYGDIYASKSWQLADGRRVWLGWVYEASEGCEGVCGEGSAYTARQGWQGAQTLVSEITYDPVAGKLMFFPVEETDQLRNQTLYRGEVTLKNGSYEQLVTSPEGPEMNQMEVQLKMTPQLIQQQGNSISGRHQPFMVGIDLLSGQGSSTKIFLGGNMSVVQDNGTISMTDINITVDNRATGGANRFEVQGGPCPPQPGLDLTKDGNLNITIYVDHSVLEVFPMRGRCRLTSRVYPPEPSSPYRVAVFAESGTPEVEFQVDIMIWSMSSCWLEGYPTPDEAPADDPPPRTEDKRPTDLHTSPPPSSTGNTGARRMGRLLYTSI